MKTPELQLAELLAEKERRIRYDRLHHWFPDTGPFRRELYKKHVAFMNASSEFIQRAFIAANQSGKELRISEPVLTPNGWVKIGELDIGSSVCTPEGTIAQVTGIFDQGLKDIYRIHFDDRTYVDCGYEHLWLSRSKYSDNWSTKVFSDIKVGDHIPYTQPVRYSERTLPVDPYLLGLLLGDGHLTPKSAGISSGDEEILDYCREQARGFSCELRHTSRYDYYFTSKLRSKEGYGKNLLVDALRELNVLHGTFDKFVPDIYKYSNHRLALLQGLMDSDGYYAKNGTGGEFTSVSKQLAQDVIEILQSLGVRCTLNNKKTSWTYLGIKKFSTAYRVAIGKTSLPLFRLERKLKNQALNTFSKRPCDRIIKKIELVGRDQARCISVDSSNKTYIISNYTVTHNTQTGGFEIACHLTGLYPSWYTGKRFHKPTSGWAASKTTAVTAAGVQQALCGPSEDIGSGMIPKDCIVSIHKKSGSSADAYDKVVVKHVSGGLSTIHFKSYDMGREVFQSATLDFIWLDEEPSDPGIYSECLTRVVASEGIILCTFTPLYSMSQVVLSFLKSGKMPQGGIGEAMPGKFVANVSWDDVPHLSTERKNILLGSYSEHERDARTKGLPGLGSGAIYPYNPKEYTATPFEIPNHWPRWYGMDVGWNVTACVWFTKNPDTNTIYVYDEHYAAQKLPIMHAAAIKDRGDYIPGFIDPASRQTGNEGTKLFELYQSFGLILHAAENAVNAGILLCNQFFAAGRIKIWYTCPKLLEEIGMYCRDEKGNIVKQFDHSVDAMRYGLVSGADHGVSKYDYYRDLEEESNFYSNTVSKQRDNITGY